MQRHRLDELLGLAESVEHGHRRVVGQHAAEHGGDVAEHLGPVHLGDHRGEVELEGVGKGPAVRPPEPQLAVRASIDFEAILMHRAVVSPTQQHEVRERRRATLRPVMDVVALTKAHAAAREAAAAVAVEEGAT